MNVIRGIVRALIRETNKALLYDPRRYYIGNYSEAEKFAKDFLKLDIPDLEYFYLNEYLPKEKDKREVWSFESSTMSGLQMNITIERKMVDERSSAWRLIYSEAWSSGDREPMQANVIEDTGWIGDYEEFKKASYRLSNSWTS